MSATLSNIRAGGAFLAVCILTVVSADAKTFYFPHSVDGAGFSMLFSLSNPGSAAATGTLSVFDSLGVPQALPFSTGPASQISIALPPNSTRVFTTIGASNPAKVGFVVVQIDQDAVTGVAVFRGAGFEASVLPVSASRKFAMFVERSATLDTGISIVKLSEGTAITLTVYDLAGVAAASTPYSFSGRKDAKFFGELFGTLSINFQGMLVIEANGDVAPVGLRFGGGVLSTIPVVDLQPGPFISSVSPASGNQGQTISNFMVSGVNFQPASTISFSGSGITLTSYTTRTATQLIASISIASGAAQGPRDVTVTNPDSRQVTSAGAFTVTAVPLPSIGVTPSSLNFGNVTPGQTRNLPLTVSNNGNAPLAVSGLTSSNPVFSVVSPAVPFTVAAGDQQIVTVRFSPPGSGVQSGTLAIASNDPARSTITVAMSGTGLITSTAPAIGNVTVTRGTGNTVVHVIPLSDPDGDVVRIDFSWFTSGVLRAFDFIESPTDINLAGRTQVTLTVTFIFPASIDVSTLNRVDIQATDSQGNKSNMVAVNF